MQFIVVTTNFLVSHIASPFFPADRTPKGTRFTRNNGAGYTRLQTFWYYERGKISRKGLSMQLTSIYS